MAKVTELSKYAAKKTAKTSKHGRAAGKSALKAGARPGGSRNGTPAGAKDIDHFIKTSGLDTRREKEIGQHIGYRYDVNLVPDYSRLTPFL
jgi:hypothetical protein